MQRIILLLVIVCSFVQIGFGAMNNWNEQAVQHSCQFINRSADYCEETFEDLNTRLSFYLDKVLMRLDETTDNDRFKVYTMDILIKRILEILPDIRNDVDRYMYAYVVHYLDIYRIYVANDRDYFLGAGEPEAHRALQDHIPDIKYYRNYDVVLLETSEYVLGDEIIEESNDPVHVLSFQVANNTNKNVFIENLVIDVHDSQYLDFSYLSEAVMFDSTNQEVWELQLATVWGRESLVYVWYPPIIRPNEVMSYDIKIKIEPWFATSHTMYGRFEARIDGQDLRITNENFVFNNHDIKYIPSTSKRTWIKSDNVTHNTWTTAWVQGDLSLKDVLIKWDELNNTDLFGVTVVYTWTQTLSHVSLWCQNSLSQHVVVDADLPSVTPWESFHWVFPVSGFGSGYTRLRSYRCDIDSDQAISEDREDNNMSTVDYRHMDRFLGTQNIWSINNNLYIYDWIQNQYMMIPGVDIATFDFATPWVINHYYKDAFNVYFFPSTDWKTLSTADPWSFEVLSGVYAKDQYSVYRNGESLVGSNVSAFVTINDYIAKDNLSAYHLGFPIPGSDPQSFDALNLFYSKDSANVYFRTDIVVWADLGTFVVDPQEPYKASDQYRTYTNGIAD